ncbi:hypothetical protein [Serratia oryzae]|uniref:hypothetical protein n=1 Tax=Serratia oryzae TaxID=2034155 RepID=UPI0012E306B4|nr:hypothetical protein [Serratia oryzae]
MKKIFFFDLPFVRHDLNAPSESQFRRILAGDKVFYTYSRQFLEANVLNRLVEGDRVYIGAHQLADGIYWLHWLASEEKGVLQPKVADISKLRATLKLMGGLGVIGASIYAAFQWVTVWLMVLLLFVFCFGCWLFASSFQALLVGTSSKMRRLLQGLEQVKTGDVSICHSPALRLPGPLNSPPTQQTSDEQDNDLDALQAADLLLSDRVMLASVSGVATEVSARRDFTGSGKSRRDFIDYQFTCNGSEFSFRSGFNTLTEDLNPLFFRQHPFFLAENDPLTLVVNQQDNRVLGVCNERDGCAYLKVGGIAVSFQQMKLMYKLMTGICLFSMMTSVLYIANKWWEQGGMPDKWDWLDAVDFFYGIGLMTLMMFCIFMLLIELSSWLVRKYSLSAARFAFARQMLTLFKRRRGEQAHIQEVN